MMQVYVSSITPFLKGDIWKQFIDRLDMERQEKVMRTRNEKDQVRILAAGLLLQYAVEQELGRKIPGTSLCIRQKEGGKPYLVDYPQIHFNLSHSGEMVACAIGTIEVGVDIQQLVSVKEKVAARFFTEKENENLKQCATTKEYEKMFFQYWCRKESYVKLTGEGLGGIAKYFLPHEIWEKQLDSYQLCVSMWEKEKVDFKEIHLDELLLTEK